MGKRRWTDEEIEFLVKNYETMRKNDIARLLNRTILSVERYAQNNGITLSKEERSRRFSQAATTALHAGDGQFGPLNPNWKGGVSKDNYRYKKTQRQRYPEKVRARELVHRALKRGDIIKGVCVLCGNADVQAHHDDYSRPLDIIWLCRKHHRELHDSKNC